MSARAIELAAPASGEIIGRRDEQQDHHWVGPVIQDDAEGVLIIVADGMGGHAGGQVASRMAVETFRDSFAGSARLNAGDRLRQALEAANSALAATAKMRPELRGMGCTLIGALCLERRLVWVSVGDSLLMVAPRGSAIQRVNADHSMAPLLDRQARSGEITEAEALASDDRHVLRSALIGRKIPLVDQGDVALPPNAMVIAATDGLLSLPQTVFAKIVAEAASPETLIRRVLGAIESDMPTDQDNTTMAVVRNWAPSAAPSRGRPGSGRTLLAGLLFLGVAAILAIVALALWPQPGPTPNWTQEPSAGADPEVGAGVVVDGGARSGGGLKLVAPETQAKQPAAQAAKTDATNRAKAERSKPKTKQADEPTPKPNAPPAPPPSKSPLDRPTDPSVQTPSQGDGGGAPAPGPTLTAPRGQPVTPP